MSKIPTVALIGLPNAGKSTLLNRICGERIAVVANEAHTTRDLNWGEDVWENMFIKFVDTGGLVPDSQDKIISQVQIKSWSAIQSADLLLWMMDRKQDPDTIHEKILSKIWKSGKPFIIGVNKVDSPKQEVDIASYARLGADDFINFSAANGYNLNELMDMIVEKLKELGFEADYSKEILNFENEVEEEKVKKGKKYLQSMQYVRQNKDGSYYVEIVNNDGSKGAMFETFKKQEKVVNKIDNVIFDLDALFED
jgi:small GTP-binding protein